MAGSSEKTPFAALTTRRRLLGAGVAALAAAVTRAVGAPEQARAANGDPLTVGQSNVASAVTSLDAGSASALSLDGGTNVLSVHANSGGHGVVGTTGFNGAGLAGGAGGNPGSFVGKAGVYGFGFDPNGGAMGVFGESGTGPGVNARSTSGDGVNTSSETGAGLRAESTQGVAVDAASLENRSVYARSNAGTSIHSFSGLAVPPNPPTDPTAVYGEAIGANATGVWAFSSSDTGTGVYGESSIGVWGFGGWGVFGSSDATGTGVYGFSGGTVPAAPAHTGVFGYSDSGTGIYAKAGTLATGRALAVNGKAVFTRSGRAGVAAGKSYVDVDMTTRGGLGGTPLCFATPMTLRSGVYVNAVRPNYPTTGKMRIYLNKVASTTSTTYVAYLVLS